MIPNAQNLHNFKIGIYIENEQEFMSLEADAIVDKNEVKINIPKIKLSGMQVNRSVDTHRESQSPYLIKSTSKCILEFPIVENENCEYLTLTVKDFRKEMTQEEIEEKLGYKIKIKL